MFLIKNSSLGVKKAILVYDLLQQNKFAFLILILPQNYRKAEEFLESIFQFKRKTCFLGHS